MIRPALAPFPILLDVNAVFPSTSTSHPNSIKVDASSVGNVTDASRPNEMSIRQPFDFGRSIRITAKIWRLFPALDRDNNGRITEADLHRILRENPHRPAIGQRLPAAQAELRQIALLLLKRPQALGLLAAQTPNTLLATIGQAVQRHFRFLDTAGTGTITWDNLQWSGKGANTMEWGERRELRAALAGNRELFLAIAGQDGVITRDDLARFAPPGLTPNAQTRTE